MALRRRSAVARSEPAGAARRASRADRPQRRGQIGAVPADPGEMQPLEGRDQDRAEHAASATTRRSTRRSPPGWIARRSTGARPAANERGRRGGVPAASSCSAMSMPPADPHAERRRAQPAAVGLLMLRQPNLLLLDEPTNNLDIPAWKCWKRRWTISRARCWSSPTTATSSTRWWTAWWNWTTGAFTEFLGGYTDYLAARAGEVR